MQIDRHFLAALTLAVGCACELSSAATFQGIGELDVNNPFSEALGVSGDGQVVVGRSKNTSGETEAIKWTAAGSGTMTALGHLQTTSPRVKSSEAYAASHDGSVIVGRSSSDSGTSASDLQAFHWTSSGMAGLGDLSGGDFHSEAYGVSEDGTVVVGIGTTASGEEAFRWVLTSSPSTGTMTGLGTLSGGTYSQARAVSGDGDRVIGEADSSSGYEAFSWESSPGITGMGDLATGAFVSIAYAASPDGYYAVGAGTTSTGYVAAIWSEITNDVTSLGALPGGNSYSVAKDVSAWGQVVVGYAVTSTGRVAFIYDPSRGMRDLQDVLENDYGLTTELSGWTLTEATGISDDGTVIVGIGINGNGDTEGWVVHLGRDDIDPSTHDWTNPANWDGTMAFVVLGSGDVEYELIKYVWADSNLDATHCSTSDGNELEHLHFESDVDTTKADAFWNWYYRVGEGGISTTRVSSATNEKESIAHALHAYKTGAVYENWLVHGAAADGLSNKAFADDCNTVLPSATVTLNRRLAYDEGDGSADGIYSHVAIITDIHGTAPGDCVEDIDWKCSYSGVYTTNVLVQNSSKPTAPGRSDTIYEPATAPTGTYSATFWSQPVIFEPQ